jgi:hypothetical protein
MARLFYYLIQRYGRKKTLGFIQQVFSCIEFHLLILMYSFIPFRYPNHNLKLMSPTLILKSTGPSFDPHSKRS